jgi:hypothetical protein
MGAVPVATVEVSDPLILRLVPVAAPIFGVTSVGVLANTAAPVPVSSDKALNKLAEVKEPNNVALPDEVTAPVKLALVVAEMFVKAEPFPANPVAVKIPVVGTKLNFVDVTFCGMLPVLAVTQVG